MSAMVRKPWEWAEGKIQPWHRDRVAVVYVRQPIPGQIKDRQESTGCSTDLSAGAAGTCMPNQVNFRTACKLVVVAGGTLASRAHRATRSDELGSDPAAAATSMSPEFQLKPDEHGLVGVTQIAEQIARATLRAPSPSIRSAPGPERLARSRPRRGAQVLTAGSHGWQGQGHQN